MNLYAIWCCDNKDWLMSPDGEVLAFKAKRTACNRAAREYGFSTYSEAKRKGWVVVYKFVQGQDT